MEVKIVLVSVLTNFDFYHLVLYFLFYSSVGWMVESMYMSICNKRLTNRGFAKCPLCPIYGFGALLGYLILHPMKDNLLALYITGAIVATVFEYFVGILMLRLFDEVWWDYKEKPIQFRGIICLESTLAWGVYAVVIVGFLHDRIIALFDLIPKQIGVLACTIMLTVYGFDFLFHFFEAIGISVRDYKEKANEYKERAIEFYRDFRTK